MIEICRIILPLPPRCLSPNCPPGSIGSRMRKASAAKKQRRLAFEASKNSGITTGPWKLATVHSTFYHKTVRRRDDVNHLAMLKSAYVGVVDSGLLIDDDSDHLKTQTPDFKIDRDNPRVELVFERIL